MSQDVEVQKRQDPAVIFKEQVAKTENEFRAALPAHIPVDRFKRVVMTAVVNNPSLLEADRRSLFEAAMKAAQDGLLPDGREGALVIFNAKIKGRNGDRDQWIKKVQWMPMISGILKKVRNSGELSSISAQVVYSNDEFNYELGDDEKITHRPALDNRGVPRLLYAIAKLKDGGVYREIMTVADVERVRAISRSANDGPWVVWWSEMARKTVLRRLSKYLPMSSDLDDLIRRDDHLPESDAESRQFRALATSPDERLKIDLDAIAASGNGEKLPPHDPETGEIREEMSERAKLFEKTATAANAALEEKARTAEALADPTGEKAAALLAAKIDERANHQADANEIAATTPPQREDAGAVPPETVPASEYNQHLEMLIAKGRARAIEGPKAFKSWKARLTVAEYAIVEPHLPSIEKATA